jgi:hypothetical protein
MARRCHPGNFFFGSENVTIDPMSSGGIGAEPL